jgi:DNA-binding NarL/FixJ family response regulator
VSRQHSTGDGIQDPAMIRILLADDHVMVRRGLRALLEARPDFAVCGEADDGKEAVALATKNKPDVAIVDVSLPILNGVEVTRQIRRYSPATEVLIYTMHDSDELIHDVLRAGARGILLKADTAEQIINAVSALARHCAFFSSRVSDTLLDTFLEQIDAGKPGKLLTARENEVVQLVAEGNSNKKVALLLGVSVKTVETHRFAAMRKLGIRSTADLVRYAVRNRLIQV